MLRPIQVLSRTAFHPTRPIFRPSILRKYTTTVPRMAPLPSSFPLKVAGGETIDMPVPGYGTWASDGSSPLLPAEAKWIHEPIKVAMETGYRHLECAWYYGVDQEIGKAIRDYGIDRKELFISSKVWCNFYRPEAVEMCCDKILNGMQIDYLDCLLLHWPIAMEPISMEVLQRATAAQQAGDTKKGVKTKDGKPVIDWKYTSEPIARAGGHEGSIVPTWDAMSELVRKGKVRAIGVSNFDIADLKALLPHVKDIPISVNQIEVHPWYPNTELINFNQQHGIVTTCFSPFAGQKSDGATLIKDPTVIKLAEKNNMGVGQLLQSWAVQRGTVPLGKSGNPDRIRANYALRELSDEDMKTIDNLEIPDGKGRTIDLSETWGVKLWQKTSP